MNATTKLTLYSGHGSIGGSQFVVECTLDGQTTRILIDCGMNFSRTSQYYNFLLRATRLEHLIKIKAMPDIPAWYRRDLIGQETEQYFDAIILTHAHMDHIAGLAYLDERPPIYASEPTVKVIQLYDQIQTRRLDTSFNSFRQQIEGVAPAKRPVITRDFRATKPGEPFELGPLTITLHAIDHSMLGTCAVEVKTPNGTLVYGADMRFDGRRGQESEAYIGKMRGMDVLLVEGTNIDDAERGLGEEGVRDQISREAQEIPGKLVIVFFGPRDFERLQTCAEAALASGRRLVVEKRIAYQYDAIREVCPDLKSLEELGILAYSEDGEGDEGSTKTLKEWKWPKVTAEDLRNNPGLYIYQTTFYGLNTLHEIEPPAGSKRINARCEPFNVDMEVDAERAENWDKLYGLELSQVHTSGHMVRPDIERTLASQKPGVVIPVHTINPRGFLEITDRPVVIPGEGIVEYDLEDLRKLARQPAAKIA